MALQSRLFRNDAALQKCLVQDSAHVLTGNRGPHVAKIQKALVILEQAPISDDEVTSELYGRSTADSVLAYKRKRQIINFSYQKTADNIVGKMTIRSLDEEIKRLEGNSRPINCLDETRSSPTSRTRGRSRTAVGLTGFELAPARLNVAIQEAFVPGESPNTNSLRNVLLIGRATTLLAPFNLQLVTTFLPSVKFQFAIGEDEKSEILALRKAAEAASPGLEGFLRVIHHRFRPTTSTGVSHGERTQVKGFKNFVLLNKNKLHEDLGTLLHEMIHCSDDELMNDIHDPNPESVYATGKTLRTFLQLEHAKFLRKSFFSVPRG